MSSTGFLSTVPKLIAVAGVFPLAALVLWFAWKTTGKSRAVQVAWLRVEAQVVDTSQDDAVTLEFTWDGKKTRRDVKRRVSLKDLAPAQTISLFVNPADPAELRPAAFGELWGNSIVLGVFSLLLAGTGLYLLRMDEPKLPEMPAGLAVQLERSASNPPPSSPFLRHEDDGGVIQMREPRESWKANVFWGLLLGLLLVVPSCFAPKDTPAWKKYGAMALGVAWMAFMGQKAIQNHGRTVRCDMVAIQVSQAFGSKRIPLSEVKKLARSDVRQNLRNLENIGQPKRATKPLDTRAALVLYILRDAQGKELLRLDKNMEPASEIRRFLDRMDNLIGGPIADE